MKHMKYTRNAFFQCSLQFANLLSVSLHCVYLYWTKRKKIFLVGFGVFWHEFAIDRIQVWEYNQICHYVQLNIMAAMCLFPILWGLKWR